MGSNILAASSVGGKPIVIWLPMFSVSIVLEALLKLYSLMRSPTCAPLGCGLLLSSPSHSPSPSPSPCPSHLLCQFLSLIWSHLISIFWPSPFLFLILESTSCFFPRVSYWVNRFTHFLTPVSLPMKCAKEWLFNSWIYESQMRLYKVRSFVNCILYKNINFMFALTFSFLKSDWVYYLDVWTLFCFPNCDCFQWV